ncbi:MAG: SMC family ATPase [bacterium]
MKPIRLEFYGLHSYCDPQDIDFAWLGASGLFGIFGPTGAGKSTILDAMTLALYGNVERASKGTQGIIHQNCDKLMVRFEFELAQDRYRVEQLYHKGKDDSQAVVNKKSLLCRFDPESGKYTPKVEKITEVKAAIQKLIGLSEEEFTRAVVLPQGKFDAFLSLKGKDKAAMLENIFNLSCYGQKIFEKASRAKEQATSRKRELEGEVKGLGDCSLATLEVRRKEKARLSSLLAVQKTNLEKLRQEEEVQRRVKGWHEEKVELEKHREALEEQEEVMKQKKNRITLAEKAERCRTDLEMLRSLQQAQQKESLNLTSQQKALNEQQILHQKCEENQKAASRDREEKLPGLYEMREKLKSCLEIHAQHKEKKKEQARQQAESVKVQDELSQLSDAITKDQQKLHTEREQLQMIDEEIDKNRVAPDQKRVIHEAFQQLALMEDKEKSLAQEMAGLEKTLDEQEQAEHQWMNALKGHFTASAFWSANEAPFSHSPLTETMTTGETETLDWLEKEKKGIQEALEQCDRGLDLMKLRSEGAHLALHLKEGLPCPVCGSKQHPAPALSEGLKEDLARLQAQKKNWLEEQKKLSRFELRLTQMATALSGSRKEIEKQKEKVARMEEEVRGLTDALKGKIQDHDLKPDYGMKPDQDKGQDQDLNLDYIRRQYQTLTRQEKTLALYQEQHKKQTRLIEELRLKIEAGMKKKGELDVRKSGLQSSLTSLAQGIADLERTIREVTQGRPIRALIQENETAIASVEKRFHEAQAFFRQSERQLQELHSGLDTCRGKLETLAESEQRAQRSLGQRMAEEEFTSIEAVKGALMDKKDLAGLQKEVKSYQEAAMNNNARLTSVAEKLEGHTFDLSAYGQLVQCYETLKQQVEAADRQLAVVDGELEKLEKNHLRWQEIEKETKILDRRIDQADELARLLKGRALVTFLSHEYLEYMCREASHSLRFLTQERYSLRVDQDNNFFMIDSFNGGKERPVSSLSGGETFLTALSLALALSSQVQSRGRSQHLGFFFLDEGFGTLDNEKLDLVMNTLERLQSSDRTVGIISHVQELRERMPRYLEVFPARGDGTGSRIKLSGQ